uniref:Uncharacterized protein n=1 Tax=Oncorhynchus kisutch TaxID=8019 RepID=A0A8C7ISW2_ONCKI
TNEQQRESERVGVPGVLYLAVVFLLEGLVCEHLKLEAISLKGLPVLHVILALIRVTSVCKQSISKFIRSCLYPSNSSAPGWTHVMYGTADVRYVLFFDCSNQMGVCIDRCLERGKSSRCSDDNRDSLQNPIEQLWEMLELRLKQRFPPPSTKKLECCRIHQIDLQTLVESMPSCIEAVQACGGPAPYLREHQLGAAAGRFFLEGMVRGPQHN